ncbi:MAG: tRNA dihydrouridine synthase DusB [Spongiibacteraceae bacterium]|nr:tRNA dihydrouridine synthase DusB [Spongiibacteraceae bacterium]
MFQVGPYSLASRVVLAPMAGVTDLPFRQLCRRFGAKLTTSEMVTSDSRLWNTSKSQHRLNHTGESQPRSVQIAGSDPAMMAQAAKLNVDLGAQIIDINMGCPAKKVCKKSAGSALMKDEPLVANILQAVVAAVDIPVTLKIRTGWSPDQRNAVRIALIAQDCGIAALAIHGRTRACAFKGEAEYNTIAQVKAAIDIPVIANGDIDSPQKAHDVIQYTGADAVMIGRAAQGKPWIFSQIDQFLSSGVIVAPPSLQEIQKILENHLSALYAFYGEFTGLRIARKHVGWYLKEHSHSEDFRRHFNQVESAAEQGKSIENYFQQILQNDTTIIENQEVIAA